VPTTAPGFRIRGGTRGGGGAVDKATALSALLRAVALVRTTTLGAREEAEVKPAP